MTVVAQNKVLFDMSPGTSCKLVESGYSHKDVLARKLSHRPACAWSIDQRNRHIEVPCHMDMLILVKRLLS